MVDVSTDTGILISEFNKLDRSQRDRILGYVEAFMSMKSQNATSPYSNSSETIE